MSAESYLGVPLRDSTQTIIGHLVIIDDKTMARDPLVLSVMETFASRAGVELERARAFDSLRRQFQESEERLRVLQEQEFEPIGSSKTIQVDVRIIAATNRDLSAGVADGKFRRDLYYRLNVFPIAVPSLRERVADIPLLVSFFLQKFAKKSGKPVKRVPEETMRRLAGYAWPGNIRELQNVIERAILLSPGDTLTLAPDFGPAPETRSSRREEALAEVRNQRAESRSDEIAATSNRYSRKPTG